jgi:hypothetical protein
MVVAVVVAEDEAVIKVVIVANPLQTLAALISGQLQMRRLLRNARSTLRRDFV